MNLSNNKNKYMMGIDEAGRGSLIGPMIVAGVVIEEDAFEKLRASGVRDSKQLSPERREKLIEVIRRVASWIGIVEVTPREIDEFNLNTITLNAMCWLLKNAISDYGSSLEVVYIDNVSGIKEYMVLRKLSLLEKDAEKPLRKPKIVIEPKADRKYLPVAAASIVAKVIRDKILFSYKEKYGLEGSGYPSDTKTTSWLFKNIKEVPPDIVRWKWKTVRNLGLGKESGIGDLTKYLVKRERG